MTTKIAPEDKVELSRKRAELVELSLKPLPPEERVRVQGELSVINAKIKALNTLAAAKLKADADRRKALGLAEARANTARARARIHGSMPDEPEDEDDDPGQTAAIDSWIDAVLLRNDVDFTRSADGTLSLDVAPKWAVVMGMLVEGIYAAARGAELPDLPSTERKLAEALPPVKAAAKTPKRKAR